MQEDGTNPDNGRLTELTASKQRDVVRRWRRQNGMDGPRGGVTETPDDPVAYKLLDAAGESIGKGESQQGIAILKLIAKEFRTARKRQRHAWPSTV